MVRGSTTICVCACALYVHAVDFCCVCACVNACISVRGPQRPIFLYEISKSLDSRNGLPDFWYDFLISYWFFTESWFLRWFLDFYFEISVWFYIVLGSSDVCFYHHSTLRPLLQVKRLYKCFRITSISEQLEREHSASSIGHSPLMEGEWHKQLKVGGPRGVSTLYVGFVVDFLWFLYWFHVLISLLISNDFAWFLVISVDFHWFLGKVYEISFVADSSAYGCVGDDQLYTNDFQRFSRPSLICADFVG